jgi:hypothetical protein
MNTAQSIGLAVFIAIGSLAGLIWLADRRNPEVREVVIRIEGSAGGTVTVMVDADGENTTTEKNVPCDIVVAARNRVGFSVNRTEGEGTLEIEMEADGVLKGRTSSPRGALGRLEFDGTKVILSSITGL